MTIDQIIHLRETEDKVEFKEAKTQYTYNKERRSILGYVVALANECGGKLILGVKENKSLPHTIVGTTAWEGKEKELEEDIYRDLKIRVYTEVLYWEGKRVLIIDIPSRPIGRTLKFEDVPLMRVGELLLPMSDEHLLKILQEQEPDFSAKICEDLSFDDLDPMAISLMKKGYAQKQKNALFEQLSIEQTLSDLRLIDNKGNFTYACLILLGKKEIIQTKLPQCKVVWEFRNLPSQIHFDTKIVIEEPFFVAINEVWKLINQPILNKKYPIQSEAYIFDLYDFNEEVVREAILNAMAHRDYTISSEILIKQYPKKIIINNPGGFPKGVTLDNLLIVNSTPRSRLMTEILEKTGLVERSGQGVDKIYSIMLSEGKLPPDYTASDTYQVSLTLNAEIIDKSFHIYINTYQKSDKEPKLGVEQIITLYKIRNGLFQNLKIDIVGQLEKLGLILRTSNASSKYVLNSDFYLLEEQNKQIGKRYIKSEISDILLNIQDNELKIGDLEENLSEKLNRNQIKYLLTKLKEDGIINTFGKASGTKYILADEFKNLRGEMLLEKVIERLYELN